MFSRLSVRLRATAIEAAVVNLLQRGYKERRTSKADTKQLTGAATHSKPTDSRNSGDAVPLKPKGTVMSEALVEMSAKGLGCVVIVDDRGHVAGIITDGDLRRKMRPDLQTASVDEIMTAAPKVPKAAYRSRFITPDGLAASWRRKTS